MIKRFFSFLPKYEVFEAKFFDSTIVSFVSKLYHKFNFIKFFKKSVSKVSESSLLFGSFKKFTDILPELSLRSYGIITFFAGIILVLFNAFRLIGNIGFANSEALFSIGFGGFLVLVSGIMSVSTKTLGTLLNESIFLSGLLFKVLLLNKQELESKTPYSPNNFILVFSGISLGILAVAFGSINVLLAILICLLLICVFKKPEAGILLTCLMLPFINGKILYFMVGLSCASVLFKVLRNKRVLKFGLFDLGVLFFVATVLLCGLFGLNSKTNLQSTFALSLLFFFGWIVSNTIKTTELSLKCIKVLTISVTFAAFLGILNYIVNIDVLNDISFLFNYVNPFFNKLSFVKYGSFALFSVLILPFTLSFYNKFNLSGITFFIINYLFVFISGKTELWVASIVVLMIYFGIKYPKTIVYFIILFITAIVINVVFPDIFSFAHNIFHGISNHDLIENAIVISNNYGLESSVKFMLSGVGNGQSVIDHIYNSNFGYGSNIYSSSSSYIISLILMYGITGVISLICCFFLVSSNCLGLIYYDKFSKKECFKPVISCLSSLCTFAIAALFLPFNMTDNLVLYLIIIAYISISIRKSLKIEYVPSYVEFTSEEY